MQTRRENSATTSDSYAHNTVSSRSNQYRSGIVPETICSTFVKEKSSFYTRKLGAWSISVNFICSFLLLFFLQIYKTCPGNTSFCVQTTNSATTILTFETSLSTIKNTSTHTISRSIMFRVGINHRIESWFVFCRSHLTNCHLWKHRKPWFGW